MRQTSIYLIALLFALSSCSSPPAQSAEAAQQDSADWAALGVAAYERGNFAGALTLYEGALVGSPDDAQLLDLQGEALCELGRHEEALFSLNRALTIEPDLAYAHSHKAQVLLQLGRFEEARASAEDAIRFAPDVEFFRTLREAAARRR